MCTRMDGLQAGKSFAFQHNFNFETIRPKKASSTLQAAHPLSLHWENAFEANFIKLLAMRQLVGREQNFHNNHISRIVLIKKFFIRNNLAHKYKTCTAAYYECSTFSCSLHNIPLSLSPPLCEFFSVLPFSAHFYTHMVKVKHFLRLLPSLK